MKKKIFVILGLMLLFASTAVFAKDASEVSEEQTVVVQQDNSGLVSAVKYLAAALAVGVACIGGAMAVGKIGAAAMGAMSENAELSGKALPFLGLAEGICLWGFIVAFLIIFM